MGCIDGVPADLYLSQSEAEMNLGGRQVNIFKDLYLLYLKEMYITGILYLRF